jgi:hypothetical protein
VLRLDERRDDREVIGDLRIVEDRLFGRTHSSLRTCSAKGAYALLSVSASIVFFTVPR